MEAIQVSINLHIVEQWFSTVLGGYTHFENGKFVTHQECPNYCQISFCCIKSLCRKLKVKVRNRNEKHSLREMKYFGIFFVYKFIFYLSFNYTIKMTLKAHNCRHKVSLAGPSGLALSYLFFVELWNSQDTAW